MEKGEKKLLAVLPAEYTVNEVKYEGVNVFILNDRNEVARYFVQEKNIEDVGLSDVKVDKFTDFYSIKTYLEEGFNKKLKLTKVEVSE